MQSTDTKRSPTPFRRTAFFLALAFCLLLILLAVETVLVPSLPARSVQDTLGSASQKPDGTGGTTSQAASVHADPKTQGLSDEFISDRIGFLKSQIQGKAPRSMSIGADCDRNLLAPELTQIDQLLANAAQPYGHAAMMARQLRAIILTVTGRVNLAVDELHLMLDHSRGNDADQIRYHLGVLLAKNHMGAQMNALVEETRNDPTASGAARSMMLLFESAANTSVGQPFPQFSFMDSHSQGRNLADYRDKVLLLHIWVSKNPRCEQEWSQLRRIYEQDHDRGLEMLGLNCDASPDKAGPLMSRPPWPQVLQDPVWNFAPVGPFGASSMPCMYVIDRKGLLVCQARSVDEAAESIEKALNESVLPANNGSGTDGAH
jgi:hypothetical protein